ncbi:MAG: hypothetical protein HJJLKODD_00408 [Phycisphaerae bacterium]|nr:hypothetical protein [Phycisphaerae bacterium]
MDHLRHLLLSSLLVVSLTGCTGRLIREGAGVATGASGVVIELIKPADLESYRGLQIDPLTVAAHLDTPDDLPQLIREAYIAEPLDELKIGAAETPALRVTGEIIHYEAGDLVDQAIGPLSEVIIRTQLFDASTHEKLGEANLIGRSKATTTSGRRNLAEGAGKALRKWLAQRGIEEQQKEED